MNRLFVILIMITIAFAIYLEFTYKKQTKLIPTFRISKKLFTSKEIDAKQVPITPEEMRRAFPDSFPHDNPGGD